MTEIRWREYANASDMTLGLVRDIEQWLSSTLEKHAAITIALPGGKSPWPIYRLLVTRSIEWQRITIIPSDDRMAPLHSPLSNFSQLQQCFGRSEARLHPLIADASLNYHEAGRVADKSLADVPWPPQLVWLGMGLDGHTASIFPGADLSTALDLNSRAVGVLPNPLPPEAPVARVTLTRTALVSAEQIIVVINGAVKRAVIESALAQGSKSTAPIAQVLSAASRPVQIYWSPT